MLLRLIALSLSLAVILGCGDDDNPVSPAPEPPPTQVNPPTQTPVSGVCRVGQVLGPGESCRFGTAVFEVDSDGFGCVGPICAGRSVSLNNFKATKTSSTPVRWTIEQLP